MTGKNGLLLVLGLFLILFCEQTSSKCSQLTACSCIFPDGLGFNLAPLADSKRPLMVTDKNDTFYFHPCTNALLSSIDSSECRKGNGVSLCVDHGNRSFSLGTAEETKIIVDADETKPPLLTIHHINYTTTMSLTCCHDCNTHLVIDSLSPDNKEYHFLLVSPHACKTRLQDKGLSTGSMLLIAFFVYFGVYFIGGAIILKLVRGATGWEMVPNHEFWQKLPSLVKDGIVFTFNCCRLDSYERI